MTVIGDAVNSDMLLLGFLDLTNRAPPQGWINAKDDPDFDIESFKLPLPDNGLNDDENTS